MASMHHDHAYEVCGDFATGSACKCAAERLIITPFEVLLGTTDDLREVSISFLLGSESDGISDSNGFEVLLVNLDELSGHCNGNTMLPPGRVNPMEVLLPILFCELEGRNNRASRLQLHGASESSSVTAPGASEAGSSSVRSS